MKFIGLLITVILLLSLLMTGCNLRAQFSSPTSVYTGNLGGTLGAVATNQAAGTVTVSSGTQNLTVTSTPPPVAASTGTAQGTDTAPGIANPVLPSATSVGGLPVTGGEPLDYLSTLLTLPVVDNTGKTLGTVQNFILNICEAQVLYIVLNPGASLGIQSGSQVLIPYSAVIWKTGSQNTPVSSLVVDIRANQLSGAPLFKSASIDLTTWDWEANVINYWSRLAKITMTTECSISTQAATPTATSTGIPGYANTQVPVAPTWTSTTVATNTPVPIAPTATSAPTATNTQIPIAPTATSAPVATKTPVPILPTPTNTAAATSTPVTIVPTPTSPPAATDTPVPIIPTPTLVPAATSTIPVVGTLPVTPTVGLAGLSYINSPSILHLASFLEVVHRIAYAKDVLEADFTRNNGSVIGKVKEVIVDHKTGLLRYVVVQASASFDANQELYLVPLGAITIRRQAQANLPPKLILTLLVKPGILQRSPAYSTIPDLQASNWDAKAYNYWSQYIQMPQPASP